LSDPGRREYAPELTRVRRRFLLAFGEGGPACDELSFLFAETGARMEPAAEKPAIKKAA
jgi:hypothetical protein